VRRTTERIKLVPYTPVTRIHDDAFEDAVRALTVDPSAFDQPLAVDVDDSAPTPEFRAVDRHYCRRCAQYLPINGYAYCERCAPFREEHEAQLQREREERMRQIEEERARLIAAQARRRRDRERRERADRIEARQRIREHGRRFGVEIEFTFDDYDDIPDASDIAAALGEVGIECRYGSYTHEVMDSWKIVPDGSVSFGYELVSPPMLWKDREQIRTVCAVLQELGADANGSCGLHVHHEVRDLSLAAFKRLVARWHNAQGLTDRLVALRRRSGRCEWAGRFDRRELEEISNLTSLSAIEECYVDRYRTLNITAFPKYGTVEIRQFQGTLDADEIISWVAYGQAFIADAVKARTPDRGTVRASTPVAFLDRLPFTCERSRFVMLAAASY
jgi:hypothetical protein